MSQEHNRLRILIIDDEKHVRQSFFDYFEDHSWQVFEAESGEAALDLLKRQPCPVAIVDIRMGGMDGETFIRRANKRYPEMFFLICTGSPEYEASESLRQLPCVADRVFSKPVINISELENIIIHLLTNR